MYEKDEVVYLMGEYRVAFGGRLLKPTWMMPGPANACLEQLQKGHGVVADDGHIKWLPEKHNGQTPEESALFVCKKMVHDITNMLQVILGYLELGDVERAKASSKDAARQLRDLNRQMKNP